MNPLPANPGSRPAEAIDPDRYFEQESSPYQPESLEPGAGPMPAAIRWLPHLIILWGVGYVWVQAESSLINYVAALLLVIWSIYTLIAIAQKWPPVP